MCVTNIVIIAGKRRITHNYNLVYIYYDSIVDFTIIEVIIVFLRLNLVS